MGLSSLSLLHIALDSPFSQSGYLRLCRLYDRCDDVKDDKGKEDDANEVHGGFEVPVLFVGIDAEQIFEEVAHDGSIGDV